MSWSMDQLERFIEIYRNNPCLWKIKCPEYSNKNLKRAAYQELVNYCKEYVRTDANKDFVVKKIQGMRGSFRKELNKIREAKKNDVPVEQVHTPKLWYFDLLLFTLDQEDPTENSNSAADEDSDQNSNDVNIKVESRTSELYERAREEVRERKREWVSQKRKRVARTPSFSPATSRGAKRTRASVFKANLDIMQECQQALQNRTVETTEYEAVGINVGKKLEKMDCTQAIYAEALISSVLRKGLLGQLTAGTDVSDNTELNLDCNSVMNYSNSPSPSSPVPDIIETKVLIN